MVISLDNCSGWLSQTCWRHLVGFFSQSRSKFPYFHLSFDSEGMLGRWRNVLSYLFYCKTSEKKMSGSSHKIPASVTHSLSWDPRKHKGPRENTLLRTLIKTFLKCHSQMFPQRRQSAKPTSPHSPLFLTMLLFS